MATITNKISRVGLGNWPPAKAVLAALLVGFIIFSAFDFVEALLVPQAVAPPLRLAHFIAGFLACAGGMLIVWSTMSRKEKELTELRDRFAAQLALRTRELDNTARRLETTLVSMRGGVICTDESGAIVLVSERAELILGIKSADLLGHQMSDLGARFAQSEMSIGTLTLAESVSARTDGSDDAVYEYPDGSKKVLSWSCAPILLDESAGGCVVTIDDVSERRALQLALLQQREDFLAVISHRLRNPILASERIISLFTSGDFGELADNQLAIMQHLNENNRELDRLLRMLVDIYKYKNGIKDLDIGSWRLDDVLTDVAAQLHTRAEARKVSIAVEQSEPVKMRCDRKEIETLFSHLMENGIKYAKSLVRVKVKVEPGVAQILVADDGPGIAPADVSSLFNRFYVSSSDGKYSAATGAGLCLCAEIVKAHSGIISCESVPGSGTVFAITMPVTSNAAAIAC